MKENTERRGSVKPAYRVSGAGFRSGLDDLCGILDLDDAGRERYSGILARYPFLVSDYYLSLADPVDRHDPVSMQCIPDPRELDEAYAGLDDPFNELGCMPVPGVIHRYRDRAALLVTDSCAVRCRHCTRKNVLGTIGNEPSREYMARMVEYVEGAGGIREVLVTGGDPLMLDISVLDRLLDSLRAIGHVEAIRIGTRVPAALPARIDPDLCAMLARHRPLWMVTQFNHAGELTDRSGDASERILSAGIPIVNQTVLLRGVNDGFEQMRALCNGLHRRMIKPYYVLQCDPVRGACHFAVSNREARALSDRLRCEMGGLSMPVFAVDVPGAMSKMPIDVVCCK